MDTKMRLAAIAVAALTGGTSAQELFPSRTLPEGNRPHAADMNGDGIDDLVATQNSSVWVYLGLPDGGFAAGFSTQGGLGVVDLDIGDLDNDGDLDVVTAAASAGAVGVLLNNGDGTMAERVTYATVDDTRGVALGDLNGDSVLDVVATGYDSNDVMVLLGNGDGTFSPPNLRHLVGEQPVHPIVGDFTGDGLADVVVANSRGTTVSLLVGDGAGAFDDVRELDAGGSPSDLALIDFDGDGDLDLAASGYGGMGVAIFELRDDALLDAINLGVPGTPRSLAAGDMDLDGDEDLMLGEASDSALVFLRNDGVGGFTVAGRWLVGVGSTAPTIIDFTRDGAPDVAASTVGITLMPNLGGPGGVEFHEQTVYAAGPTPGHFATGDLNGDGDRDLAIAHGQFGPVTVVLSDGAGGFHGPVVYSPDEFCYTVALEDVDADGDLDLVAFENNEGRLATRLNDGEGGFGERVFTGLVGIPGSLVLADFDGDGLVDAATSDIFVFNPEVSVRLGQGDGSFGPPRGFEVGTYQRALASGDVNGDGRADLVSVPGTTVAVHVLLGRGDGTFEPVQLSTLGIAAANLITMGDLDGDGLDDVVVSGDDTVAVKVLLSNGDGTMTESATHNFRAGQNTTDLALGDADGDGALDLAIAQGRADRVALALGAGDGGLQPFRFYAAGPNIRGVELADMTGGGLPDLVTTRNFDASFGVLPNLRVACRADLDGDGELTVFDFLAFQNAFDAGDPSADFDGDGSLTLFDFLAFQNAFDAGCD
jgi:hypothetical protein